MVRELNLVPKVYNQVKEKKKKKRSAIVGIVALCSVIIVGIGYTFGYEFYLRYKLNELNKKVDMNRELIAKDQQLSSEINATMAQIEKATSLQVLKSNKTDLLFKELQKYFPTNIVVESLSYNKINVSISGKSTSKESIQELWANLRETKEFNKCHINGISEGEGGFTFTLEIILAPIEEGGNQ